MQVYIFLIATLILWAIGLASLWSVLNKIWRNPHARGFDRDSALCLFSFGTLIIMGAA